MGGDDGYTVSAVSDTRRAHNEDAWGVVARARQASVSAPDAPGSFAITLVLPSASERFYGGYAPSQSVPNVVSTHSPLFSALGM